MNRNQIIEKISSFLLSSGWTLFPHPAAALAYKMYDTAVGKRESQVYFSGDQYTWLISGDYQSQGTNILSTSSVFIAKNCSPEELNECLTDFLTKVETRISQSYAVRLL